MCCAVPATMAATAMSWPSCCTRPASRSLWRAERRRSRHRRGDRGRRMRRRAANRCRFRAGDRTRWSSMRCSGPACRKPLDGVYAGAIAKTRRGRRARGRRRPAERRLRRSGAVLGTRVRAPRSPSPSSARSRGICSIPAANYCGEVVVADIGIRPTCSSDPAGLLREYAGATGGDLSRDRRPTTHKYARGHVGVFSGGPSSTGAARLVGDGCGARRGRGGHAALARQCACRSTPRI